MARRTITIDKKVETVVVYAKKKYDAALDETEKLVTKNKQLDDKKFLKRITQVISRRMKL